ncbi:MAG: carboxymuconolactone decarboxylase family protein [Candidatus Bathyarchaeota archaeon]|nr:carboxymuconolactone decarboxylase family protein [Candidatus Bathyarchaeota archaeon]
MIKYIHPVKPAAAEGPIAEVYAQVKRDFGRVAEPFLIHSPLPKLLAGAWMVCRETELVGNVPRGIKEAVAAAVSQLNQCPYCVDAHTIMLSAAGESKVANAIGKASYEEVTDEKTFTAIRWALSTTSPGSELLRWTPFSKQEAPEIIGTAVFYHYINRLANVLLGATPLPSSRSWLKSPLKRVAVRMFTDAVNRSKCIGESLTLLPKTDLPNDLRWARTSANVAQAYACFASAAEEAGELALPVEVRAYISEELSQWTGKTTELSLAWCEDAIARFDEPKEAAARLALLTALAPYRVDDKAVLEFRQHFPQDEKLVGTLAWASFAAARKIGTWLQPRHS